MINILEKYLNKLGVRSYAELNDEEKQTYKEWEESISGRKLTDEDVRGFLNTELSLAVRRLVDVNLSTEDQAFRKAEVKLIQKIIEFLDGPTIEKEMLEKQIVGRM
jgi:hypothetical protein